MQISKQHTSRLGWKHLDKLGNQIREPDIKVQVWNIDINLEVSWISKDFLHLNIKADDINHDIEADDSDSNIVKT